MTTVSSFDPVWGIVLRADHPKAGTPADGQGINVSEKLFPPSATPYAQVRPGWQTPPRLINYSLRPRVTEFMIFSQRRLALRLWPAHARVLLRSFQPVFLTRRRTTAPTFGLSRLVSTPPSRCQNTAPASSVAPSRSTTLILARRSRITVELTLSHLLVAWRSSTLVPHRPSSGAMC